MPDTRRPISYHVMFFLFNMHTQKDSSLPNTVRYPRLIFYLQLTSAKTNWSDIGITMCIYFTFLQISLKLQTKRWRWAKAPRRRTKETAMNKNISYKKYKKTVLKGQNSREIYKSNYAPIKFLTLL